MTDATAKELRRRAAQLARPPAPPDTADTIEAVTFTWDGATYLLPASSAQETVAVGRLALVPGAQPPLLGACKVRSQLLPVIDLRPLCGGPTADRPVGRVVVVDDRSRPSLAIAVDEVHRLVALRTSDLHDPPDRPPTVRGYTAQGAALLDPDRLLDLPHLFATPQGRPS